ncbi:DUF2953 domain-containing protein [Neobacillus piezotolerans]|uniref:DUF2953 domain-containing protein n=1 Tax=Neobacillus piezotolerans TaxID=2259171 RepID=UPI0015F1306D|nr:DUF2953 domain-containing protein [Neobacillus piezotolerans]
MAWIVWIVAIITCVILLASILFLLKITVTARFRSHGGQKELTIECKAFFGLLKYKKTFNDFSGLFAETPDDTIKKEKEAVKEKTEEKRNPDSLLKGIKNGKETVEKLLQAHQDVKGFLKTVAIRRFEWYTAAGAGDAALTGIIAGAIWAAKGMIIGLLSETMKLKTSPAIVVTPYFQYTVSATMLSCMFTFRAGKAISAGMKIYKYVKKARHGRIPNGMPLDYD